MPQSNDKAARELGKYRSGHYSSVMIAVMVKEAFERGRASRELKLPSEEDFLVMYDDEYGDECKAVSLYKKVIGLIKALNEFDGESGEG